MKRGDYEEKKVPATPAVARVKDPLISWHRNASDRSERLNKRDWEIKIGGKCRACGEKHATDQPTGDKCEKLITGWDPLVGCSNKNCMKGGQMYAHVRAVCRAKEPGTP